jgi:hypothetical protein
MDPWGTNLVEKSRMITRILDAELHFLLDEKQQASRGRSGSPWYAPAIDLAAAEQAGCSRLLAPTAI